MPTIGKVFDELQATINVVNELNERVGAGEFEQGLSLDTGSKKIPVFDTPVTIDAQLDAKVRIAKPEEMPDSPFPGTTLTIPAGTQYTALTIGGNVSADAKVNATPGVLAVSASASAKTGFAYSHLRPAAATQTRLKAFTDLIATSDLPQSVDVTALVPGETVDFTTTLNIDFGLKAKYGAQADVNGVIGILESVGGAALALPFTAHIGFTAGAAFGFSLYDSMRVTTGRAATSTPDWVRIRLEREHRSRIAFGLAVDILVQYDATAGAQALLDKAFALVPKIEAVETLKKIAALPQDFDAFKAQISDKAAAIVGRLIDDTHWKDAVAASPAITALIKTANDIVRVYDQIDEKVKSIVEEVFARLDAAGLDRVRPIIDQIAAIDPDTFEVKSLLSDEAKQRVQWIETLTGLDIEELILTANVRKEIARAVDAAKKLQQILNGAEDDVLARIHGLLDKSGATGLVEWLRKHATSVADLQAAADQAISDFVKRLIGKQLDQISEADVQKIQQFAARLQTILNAPDALRAKLEAGIKKLKGEVGFSFSVELSRVSEWSAVVDVEIDPASGSAVKAARGLVNGQFQQFLSELDQIQTDSDDPRPYLLHEVLITSRRIRTSAAAAVLSIFNFSLNEQETATDEYSIAVREGDQGPVREALYAGGAVVRRKTGTTTSEGGASIRISAAGAGANVNADYSTITPVIRLTYSREDTRTDNESRQSIVDILSELSFNGALKGVPPSLVGQQTRFSLEVELGGDAVQALKAVVDQQSWNNDVLRAAQRWFLDVDRINANEQQSGHDMAVVMADPDFQQLWTNFPSDAFFEADTNSQFGIRLTPTPASPQKNFKPEYRALQMLMSHRASSFAKFTNFKASLASSPSPEVLADVAVQASNLFRTGQRGWQPPMFNFWFVFARLLRLNAQVFDSGRAVATIRSRKDANEEWSDPVIFALTEGISTSNLRLS
ncbi:MAG: hypothetical protein ACJ74H_20470 [Thermoanaerobaculia bacterium]